MPRAILALVIHLAFIRSPWIFPIFVPFLWLSCGTQPIFVEQRSKYANKKPQGLRWQGLSTHEWWLEHGIFGKEALTVIQGDSPSAGWLARAHTATCVPITKGKRYPTTGGGRKWAAEMAEREKDGFPRYALLYQAAHRVPRPEGMGPSSLSVEFSFFNFVIYLFILLFWLPWVFIAVWMLLSSCGEQGLAVHRLLTAVAFLIVEHRL